MVGAFIPTIIALFVLHIANCMKDWEIPWMATPSYEIGESLLARTVKEQFRLIGELKQYIFCLLVIAIIIGMELYQFLYVYNN
jgi:hypothetical protein